MESQGTDRTEYGTQGSNPDAGIKTEVTEEHSLLTFSSWVIQPAFLYNPVPTAQGWHCPK